MTFVLSSFSANEGRVENEFVFWGVTPCLQGSGNFIPLLGPGNHSDTRTGNHCCFAFDVKNKHCEDECQGAYPLFSSGSFTFVGV